MAKKVNSLVKILVRFYSDVLEEETVETMWASVVDEQSGLYKIENIPFYWPPIASDDIVHAEYDEDEEMLTFRKVVEYSGNSIIQVSLLGKKWLKNIDIIREQFQKLGCTSEKVNDTYFSMEVLKKMNYKKIKKFLDELEKDKIIAYAEPWLSKKHKNQI